MATFGCHHTLSTSILLPICLDFLPYCVDFHVVRSVWLDVGVKLASF